VSLLFPVNLARELAGRAISSPVNPHVARPLTPLAIYHTFTVIGIDLVETWGTAKTQPSVWPQGQIQGAGPLFLAKSNYFFTLYTMSEKIFLKLNFYFIVTEIREFLEVWGVCVFVCLCDPISLHDKSVVFYLISVGFEIVAATVFCSAKAQF